MIYIYIYLYIYIYIERERSERECCLMSGVPSDKVTRSEYANFLRTAHKKQPTLRQFSCILYGKGKEYNKNSGLLSAYLHLLACSEARMANPRACY